MAADQTQRTRRDDPEAQPRSGVRATLPASTGRRPRQKTSERVAKEIVEWVATGVLRPGDRLPAEASLVEHFEVSRGSMREALRVLENAGVVSLSTGRPGGSVIRDAGIPEFARTSTLYLELMGTTYRELLEARTLTEPLLAARAASRRTPADLEALRADLDAMASATSANAVARAEMEFHVDLAIASGNRALALYIGALAAAFTVRFGPRVDPAIVPRQSKISHTALERVYDAVANREVATAQRRMQRYLVAYAELFESREAAALEEPVRWQSGDLGQPPVVPTPP